MEKTFTTVLKIMTYVFGMSLAYDIVKWAVSGRDADTGKVLLDGMIQSSMDMPIKVLYAIVNVVIGLIEAVLKMVFGILQLDKVADKIHLEPIKA